jgi:hypothetical protein
MNTNNILTEINEIINHLEDTNNFVLADALHETFVKIAKKKKSTKKKNIPNDPALYSRCKSEIKKKFKIYPSAYANASLVRLYKSRGGTYSKG